MGSDAPDHSSSTGSAWDRLTVALLVAGWALTPSVPELPLSGAPFTGAAVFALLWLGSLIVVVLPWRSDRQWLLRRLRDALLAVLALKAAAGALAQPTGLTGTYEPLVGRDVDRLLTRPSEPGQVADYLDAAFDARRVPVAGEPGRPWRRTDRQLDFAGNGAAILGNDFHLLFLNFPPVTLFPKPHVRLPVEPPGDAYRHLDFAALRVRWEGFLELPDDAPREFSADSDGTWSVAVDGSLVAVGGPGLPTQQYPWPASDGGLRRVTVRYLRPIYPADTPRAKLDTRFRLRWAGLGSNAEPVGWRPLRLTEADTAVGSANAVAEALHWAALAGLLGVLLTLTAAGVDWSRWREPLGVDADSADLSAPRDRLIVWVLSLLCFGIGAAETARHTARDAQYNTPDAYDYKVYLTRGLAIWHDGDPTPESARPSGSGRTEWDWLGLPGDKPLPPAAATVLRRPPPEHVRFHSFGPIDALVRALATLLEGRLGRTTFYPDEPASQNNRLYQFHRNPLMDHYLAGLLWLFEERLGRAYLFQVLLAAATVALTARVGAVCFGRTVGLIAAGVLAVDLQHTKYAYFFFAEVPAAFLTTAALAAVLEARRRQRLAWYAAAGGLLGLAFLMRPNLAFLLPVAGLWLLAAGPRDARSLLARVGGLSLTGAAFGLLWCLVPVRNYQLTGEPIWTATSGPTVLIIGSDLPMDLPLERYHTAEPTVPPEVMAGWLEQVRLRCFDYSNPQRRLPAMGDPLHPAAYPIINPVLGQLYRDFAAEHPGHIARMWAVKFWKLLGPGHKLWVGLHLLVLLSAAGLCWRAWRDSAEPWLLAGAFAAVAAPLIVFYFEDRHRLPYLPLLHVLTGAVLAELRERFGPRLSSWLVRAE